MEVGDHAFDYAVTVAGGYHEPCGCDEGVLAGCIEMAEDGFHGGFHGEVGVGGSGGVGGIGGIGRIGEIG